MLRRLPYLICVLILAGGVSAAVATSNFSSGPYPSKTGAPAVGPVSGEDNCSQCHLVFDGDGNQVNNLNDAGGYVRILDLPETYSPGNTYTLRVQLWSDSTVSAPMRRWGFQLTAVKASDGSGAGTFVLPNPDSLQIVNAFTGTPWEGRQYVEHQYGGIQEGASGPVEWSFQWQAPSTPSGAVYFYVAGNAANGSYDPGGDWIYTAGDTLSDTTTAVRSTSWGGLKQLWK
jgi:hypothetical protein